MGEQTKLPWRVRKGALPGVIVDENGDQIAAALTDVAGGNARRNANAAFIVKAANSHDVMVKALEEIAALGEKVTDLKNEHGIRMGNIAHAALIALRVSVGQQRSGS